tara:strand:+ start:2574 stop:2975 length:402 start_codon:yes stop_codon:yes gene_type:complete
MIKYFLIISALMNAALIITVTGIMPFMLFLSVVVIIGLVWYIKKTLSQIEDINTDVESLFQTFQEFQEHLESIYSLEMFYGDDTLHGLIEHSRNVLDEVNYRRQKYFFDSEIVDFEDLELGEQEVAETNKTEI